MSIRKENRKETKDDSKKVLKPDPETLNTTDPQDNMEGPVSSLIQNIKEGAEDEISKEEADKNKNENM